ncbi:MAG: hypothetical protein SF172_06095 [Burkholderiales bacterium]|nr:hypothetical protein [Burkholderiales bacterium]
MSSHRDPLNLRQADGRERFEQEFKAMRAQLGDSNHSLATNTWIDLEWQFEQEVHKEQGPLLANPLMWDESDQHLAQWILRQFTKLADMGKHVTDRVAAAGKGDPVLSYVIARALVSQGNVWKWAQFANRQGSEHGFGALNALYARAVDAGLDDEAQSFNREGRPVAPTIAALCLRAHLLARVASGNLNRQQTEIFDAWLWATMGDLHLSPTAGDAAVLRIEPGSQRGLQFGIDETSTTARYLSAESLRRVAERVEQSFHRGTIFPGHGAVQSFRLEEHVAVLDFLRVLVEQIERGRQPQRAERIPKDGEQVEVHVGLSDIVRTFGAGRSGVTLRLMSVDSASENKLDTIYQMQRRYMSLVDQSESGLGLEVPMAQAADIGVGEIIAIVFADQSEPLMGQVARIVPGSREGTVRIGVHVAFDDYQAVDLSVAGAPTSRREASAFYVPGADSSGRYDVLLVSEAFAQAKPLCEVRLGDQLYDLRINHIRQKGRGWVAAGFEVVGVREAVTAEPAVLRAVGGPGSLPPPAPTASESFSLSLV